MAFKKKAAKPAKSKSPVLEFIKDNPLKIIWLSILIWGGLIILIFSFHIEYLPSLDLASATSMFLGTAYFAGIFAFTSSLALLIPAVLIVSQAKERFKPMLGKRSARKIAGLMLLFLPTFPFVFILVAVPGANPVCLIASFATVVALFCYVKFRRFKTKWTNRLSGQPIRESAIKKTRAYIRQKAGVAIVVTICQLFPVFIVCLMIFGGTDPDQNQPLQMLSLAWPISLALALASCFFIWSILFDSQRTFWIFNIPLLLVLPMVVGFAGEVPGAVPLLIAQLTKFGNIRAERVAIAPKWCSSVKSVADVSCSEKQTDPVFLCNVHVMSRLGTETYLLLGRKDSEVGGGVATLFLPTADVNVLGMDFGVKTLSAKKIKDHLRTIESRCEPVFVTNIVSLEFDFDDYVMNERAQEQLVPFVQAIVGSPAGIKEIQVIGHADTIGDDKHNKWLAGQRAKRVALHLKKMTESSAPDLVINEFAKGSTENVVGECATLKEKGRIRCEIPNRRVVVKLIPLGRKLRS